MRLAPFLPVECVEANLESVDGKGVLTELSALLVRARCVPEGTDLVTILMNREELGSTGLGGGIAIPHVRLKNVSSLRVAVGRSVPGVEFNAADGLPVHFFFLVVSSESAAADHLKALAQISRLLKKSHVRKALLGAGGREEILEVIVAEDEEE
jgi:PTS system nitrogen regulatory IIA component